MLRKILFALIAVSALGRLGLAAGNVYQGSGGGTMHVYGGNSSGGSIVAYSSSSSSGATAYGFLHATRGDLTLQNHQSYYAGVGNGGIEDGTLSTTTEHLMQVPYYTAGTFSNMWLKVTNNSMTATSTVTIRINGVNGNEFIAIPAGYNGDLSMANTSLTDSINSGDLLSWAMVGSTGTGTLMMRDIAAVFTPTSGSMMKFVGSGLGAPQSNGFGTYYNWISGSASFSLPTETPSPATIVPIAGTFKNFCVSIGTNTLNITQTARFRKNFANGNMTFTVSPNASGVFCDNTHTDHVVVGDTVDYFYDMGGTGNVGATTEWYFASEFYPDNPQQMWYISQQLHDHLLAQKDYVSIMGAFSFSDDATMRILSQVPGTMTNMAVQVEANSQTAGVPTHFSINGVDGNMYMSIPAGATGYFVVNSTQSDHVAATDLIDANFTTDANTYKTDYYSYVLTHD